MSLLLNTPDLPRQGLVSAAGCKNGRDWWGRPCQEVPPPPAWAEPVVDPADRSKWTQYDTSEPVDWADPYRKEKGLLRMDPLEIEGRVKWLPWIVLGAVAVGTVALVSSNRRPAMAGRRRRRRR